LLCYTNPARAIDQTLIEITIGDEEEERKSFMLHKDLLCAHSRYFRNACEGLLPEGEERAVHLPGVDESTLKLFQFWLYGQATREEPKRVVKRLRGKAVEGMEGVEGGEGSAVAAAAAAGGITIGGVPQGNGREEDEAIALDVLLDTRRTPKWMDSKGEATRRGMWKKHD
jgi:hypothetical protein